MKTRRSHDGPRLSPRRGEVDLPAGRIYEVALERLPWHTLIGRSVVGLIRGIILQDDPLPMVKVHVQRKDDHSVVRSWRVRTAGERDTIAKMFQDDLDRITVGDFFRRYVR